MAGPGPGTQWLSALCGQNTPILALRTTGSTTLWVGLTETKTTHTNTGILHGQDGPQVCMSPAGLATSSPAHSEHILARAVPGAICNSFLEGLPVHAQSPQPSLPGDNSHHPHCCLRPECSFTLFLQKSNTQLPSLSF